MSKNQLVIAALTFTGAILILGIILTGGSTTQVALTPALDSDYDIDAPLVIDVGDASINTTGLASTITSIPEGVVFNVIQHESSLLLISENPLPFGDVEVTVPAMTTEAGKSINNVSFRFRGVATESSESSAAIELKHEAVESLIEDVYPGIEAIETETIDYDIGFEVIGDTPVVHINIHPYTIPPRSDPEGRLATQIATKDRALEYIALLGFNPEELNIIYSPLVIQTEFGFSQ